jgi:hypothetical protein
MKATGKVAELIAFPYAVLSFGTTLLRLLLAVSAGGLAFLAFEDSRVTIAAAVLLIVIMDYVDGIFFDSSLLSAQKEWRIRRRVFDSLADRIVIQIVCVAVLIADSSFLWIYLLILSREIVLSGYSVSLFRRGLLVYPGFVAKLACGILALCVIAFLLSSTYLTWGFTCLMLIMSYCSLREYRKAAGKSNVANTLSGLPLYEIEEVYFKP